MEVQGPGTPGSGAELTCAAVDWSGRAVGAKWHIWSAAVAGGTLRSLATGRTRDQVGDDLIEAGMRVPRLAVGLDFAFSFPAWYLSESGLGSAPELWAAAARHGDEWLRELPFPFWGGKAGAIRPELEGHRPHARRTDLWVPPIGSARTRPKSPFQVGGAGSVGTGTIRGMPLLARLRRAGFSIWPFDEAPGWPRVVEIYPRLLTGPVQKSSALARRAQLERLGWPEDPVQRGMAASTEDAFDAALSARAMDRSQHRLIELPAIPAEYAADAQREGWIWSP